MTSFDFAYYKPATLQEATACYGQCKAEGKSPLYYGGGTEVISMARAESIRFDAVIDLKGIPECTALMEKGRDLVIGSAATLTAIAGFGRFPLLCAAAGRIADHTIQGKITLGGNLAGTIPYREAALPLMVTDCRAKVMGKDGLREVPFSQIFNGRLQPEEGDFLVQVLLDRSEAALPFAHVKKTKTDKIDYPLISLCATVKDGTIRAALSGIGAMPLALPAETLNNAEMSEEARAARLVAEIQDAVVGDIHGSKGYRTFVLGNVLTRMYQNFRGA